MNGLLKSKLKRLAKQSYEIAEMLEICNENSLSDINVYYQALKSIEELLSNFGVFLFDFELTNKKNYITDIGDFALSDLAPEEKRELLRYINAYCNGEIDKPYDFFPYNGGYKATLPYLLDRRAIKGVYFSPKKKYIISVFEKLLIDNQEKIIRFSRASLVIVSYSPYGEKVVRDNDNADSRDVINLVNRYIMKTDDSGAFLNIMYDSAYSDEYKTELFIMPYISYREIVNKSSTF